MVYLKKTFLILLAFLIGLITTEVPYINLIITKTLIIGLFMVVVAYQLRWKYFLLAFLLLQITLGMTLTGRFHQAYFYGFLSYMAIAAGVLEFVYESLFESGMIEES